MEELVELVHDQLFVTARFYTMDKTVFWFVFFKVNIQRQEEAWQMYSTMKKAPQKVYWNPDNSVHVKGTTAINNSKVNKGIWKRHYL